MCGQDVLCGQPDLQLLAPLLVPGVGFGGRVLARGIVVRWGVGHAQVGADHIDDGLSLGWVVLC